MSIVYSTVQYSTVQYSTVQYSTVQYSTVQYSTVVILCTANKTAKQQIYLQQKHIIITDLDINYTAAGCQGAIQLSMLAAYNFNNNVNFSSRDRPKKTDTSINTRNYYSTSS